MRVLLVLLVWVSVSISFVVSGSVEEFHSHGPMDFHNMAMDKFVKIRKEDPTADLSHDGKFLSDGTEHAIKRGSRKSKDAFKLRASGDGSGGAGLLGDSTNKILALPGPAGQERDSVLANVVTSEGHTGAMATVEHMTAQAAVFNELVGLGAISKAGALTMV